MSLTLECPCGKRITVEPNDPVARIRCPVCQELLEVPGGRSQGSGADSYQVESVRICPGCRKMWSAETAVCVECGHDFRSGKKLETVYQLRPRALVLGWTFLGTYRLYTLKRDRKNQPILVIKSWFLWIPLRALTVELKGYDSVFTDWCLSGDDSSQYDMFFLELQGPRKRPYTLWRGSNEESMRALLDMLKEGAGFTIRRK